GRRRQRHLGRPVRRSRLFGGRQGRRDDRLAGGRRGRQDRNERLLNACPAGPRLRPEAAGSAATAGRPRQRVALAVTWPARTPARDGPGRTRRTTATAAMAVAGMAVAAVAVPAGAVASGIAVLAAHLGLHRAACGRLAGGLVRTGVRPGLFV